MVSVSWGLSQRLKLAVAGACPEQCWHAARAGVLFSGAVTTSLLLKSQCPPGHSGSRRCVPLVFSRHAFPQVQDDL